MKNFIQNLESHPLFKATSRVLRIPGNRLRQLLIDNEKLVKSLEYNSGNRSLNEEFNKDTFKAGIFYATWYPRASGYQYIMFALRI